MPPAASVADQPGTPAASAAFLPGEARPGSPGPPAEEAGRVPGAGGLSGAERRFICLPQLWARGLPGRPAGR